MQCDCFRRNTLTAAWPCLLLQAISERWQRSHHWTEQNPISAMYYLPWCVCVE
ncbi:hypothetical protein Nmel_005702 [Mimus melanotis]